MSGLTRRTRPGAAQRARLTAGHVELQVCADCGHVQYPPAEVCRHCLGPRLDLNPYDAPATIVASALVHRSYRDDFTEGGPWPVGSVRLGSGATVFAHIAELLDGGTPVTLVALTDGCGEGVFGAARDRDDIETMQTRLGPQL